MKLRLWLIIVICCWIGNSFGSPCELIIGTNVFPVDLNPFVEYNHTEVVVDLLVFDGLMTQKQASADPQEAFDYNLAETIQALDWDRQNHFDVKLRGGVRFHRGGDLLQIADVEASINGLNRSPLNPYRENKLAVGAKDGSNFELIVGYPRVGLDERSLLFRYLTFPIVRGLAPEIPVTGPNQALRLNGTGDYFMSEFDLENNSIILDRSADQQSAKRSVGRVRIELVDRMTDVLRRFEDERFHAILGGTSDIVLDDPRYHLYADPSLSSFEYLGFNRHQDRPVAAAELFAMSEFRTLVWAAMDESVFAVIREAGGQRLFAPQRPSDATIRRRMKRWDSEFDDDNELRGKIDQFFAKNHRKKPPDGSVIRLVAKGFALHHEDLANAIHRRLARLFEGYLEFGRGPIIVGTERAWRTQVVEQHEFDLVLDTFYFGSRPKIMNLAFLSDPASSPLAEKINLTGSVVDRARYEEDGKIIHYDKFLAEVNQRAEVVVLGKLLRLHVLDTVRFERVGDLSAPFLHGLADWACR